MLVILAVPATHLVAVVVGIAAAAVIFLVSTAVSMAVIVIVAAIVVVVIVLRVTLPVARGGHRCRQCNGQERAGPDPQPRFG